MKDQTFWSSRGTRKSMALNFRTRNKCVVVRNLAQVGLKKVLKMPPNVREKKYLTVTDLLSLIYIDIRGFYLREIHNGTLLMS